MPRNGSGVYSLPTSPFATAGAIAVASTVNANINDIGSEITGSLPRNGSAGMTANLAMGGNKITGLAAATASGDAVRWEQAVLIDAANVFTADQTVRSSGAGAAEGPLVTLDRASASPAASDIIGGLKFSGRDSGAGTDVYARLLGTILDPAAASEDGELSIGTVVAGTLADRMVVGQGVRIGSPAGGDKGAGTINAIGYYLNNALLAAEATVAEYRANTADRALTTDIVHSAAAEVSLTDAATIAVDMALFINAVVTLGGNRTLGNPTNETPGRSGYIRIVQDGTGSRTLAYGTDWEFAGGIAPVLSTAGGAEDMLFYQVIAANRVFANLVKAIA